MNNTVVGIGEVLWDLLPQGKKAGGAPANFAYHVAQFDLNSCVVSAVGDDPLGDEITHIFEAKGLQQLITREPFPTGTVGVELDSNGIPQYEIREGVAWDNIPYTPKLDQLAKETRAVCFGSLAQRGSRTRTTIQQFLTNLPQEEEIWIVFDINIRQHFYTEEIIRSSLHLCNILKINDEELELVSQLFGLTESDSRERCLSLLSEFNLTMLILTCGVNGSYIFAHSEESFLPTPSVEVKDTVGAGDSFTAAFVASLIKGKSIKEAHQTAVQTSAYVCTQEGAMPQLPPCLTR